MNDRSRISSCGIYHHIPRASAFVWITLYPTIFYYQYLLRPYVLACFSAASAWNFSRRGVIYRVLVLSCLAKEIARAYRSAISTPPISMKETERYREIFFKHIFISYHVSQYLRNLSELHFIDSIVKNAWLQNHATNQRNDKCSRIIFISENQYTRTYLNYWLRERI